MLRILASVVILVSVVIVIVCLVWFKRKKWM